MNKWSTSSELIEEDNPSLPRYKYHHQSLPKSLFLPVPQQWKKYTVTLAYVHPSSEKTTTGVVTMVQPWLPQ